MNDGEKPVTVKPVRWYLEKKFIFLMLFIFGPFALPLLWLSPKFTLASKISITFLLVLVTFLLGKATATMYETLQQHLKDINSASGI